MLKDLTPAQQAAIYLHVVGGFNDWPELFQIAEGKERYNKLTDKSKRQTVSKFKLSDEINEGIQELRYILSLKEKKIREDERAMRETETTEGTTVGKFNEKTNFLDRDEFLQFLNDRANQIQDDKTRNDILKMLSDNLRYKDTERDENNEIQRFYTPINCENCEIYKRCKGCTISECPKVL